MNKAVIELHNKIDQMFADYVKANNQEPRYAQCLIKFLDDNSVLECKISLFSDAEDDSAFFYCDSLGDLKGLTEEGCEDFVVIDCYEFHN